jgi:hypothetical protein
MLEYVVSLMVGILCIFLGSLNMKGNISLLHSYHRKRVLEKDRIPFGRKVGIGTIIIGVSIILSSILSFITYFIDIRIFMIIGNICLVIICKI